MGAARELHGAPRHAAYAAGQAGAVAHVAAHELGAAACAIKAARAAAPEGKGEAAGRRTPDAASVGGSAISSPTLSASSYSMTSGCETASAGRYSTLDERVEFISIDEVPRNARAYYRSSAGA